MDNRPEPKYEYRTATLVSHGLVVRATKVFRAEVQHGGGSPVQSDTGKYVACVSSVMGEHVLTSVSGTTIPSHTEADLAHEVMVDYLREHGGAY